MELAECGAGVELAGCRVWNTQGIVLACIGLSGCNAGIKTGNV